ncbi:LOW QUALITY PROTEIN: hypothetical protein T265_13015 [Opisthorchis viverrini]|uniref:Uncharacterized protein n=1 Tax=Opisthorchis viverrini TaxID=6198 RepID=A0A075AIA1_OPIVI|nr:LOW QUALITY PROTEIN: hypothetical protein T265_13015 [Opisthorchis viverrini]KER31274.1 LOW QUALITY PROTEIN: hypothetical protein T265_13015 [Opisthorchis viverrini]
MCGDKKRRQSPAPLLVPLLVDTTVAQDPDTQSHKHDYSQPENPSYIQMATLIAGGPSERQPLTGKNKTDPRNLGKSHDPVYQSVNQ